MVVNGTKNIKLIVSMLSETLDHMLNDTQKAEIANILLNIDYEADILERYMLQYADSYKDHLEKIKSFGSASGNYPSWMEVRQKPSKFLNLNERLDQKRTGLD